MHISEELLKLGSSCVGLGFFDGVHKGHKVIIDELVRLSKKNSSKSCLITFKKSPAEMFIDNVKYLNLPDEKEKLISELGVDYLIRLDFNEELMKLSADEYLKMVCAYFNPKYIVSGFNHTFGKHKTGNNTFLKEHERVYNYIYKEIPPVESDGKVVSSTLIRENLTKGDIKIANKLLGYNYSIEGVVVEGNKIGRTIGFPTANIIYPNKKVEIPYGVYCAKVETKDKIYNGMLNYGIKPTINEDRTEPVAEVHIIGFNKDIYGEKIKISIIDKIRDEKKFNSIDELKNQIKEDLKQC